MANDSQREKARATFGKTFFENSKALPNPKNGAAALQKRANARPIPTYKVGGVVKKADGGKMPKLTKSDVKMGDALMLTKKGKDVLAAQARTDAEKEKALAAKRARADKLLGIPAQKGGGKAGCYADGGKAMAGAKRAIKAEQDFTGLMKNAADRAAAKGTPVMKDGGATDEYTAKRVMSRIKAGNFAEGGAAEDRMKERMRKAEVKYNIALAKGKNEGISKAKFERVKADIADDYAKKTGADRTATKAAEQAAKATLKEARRTKGVSISQRDFGADLMKKGSKELAPKTDVAATLKGISGMDVMPKAEAPKAARPMINTRRPLAPAANRAAVQAPAAPRATQQRPAATTVTTPRVAQQRPAAAAAPAAPARPKDTVRTGRDIISDFLDTSAREKEIAKGAMKPRDYAGERAKMIAARQEREKKEAEYNRIGSSKSGLAAALNANKRFAAGGAAKVRKGMMKGK